MGPRLFPTQAGFALSAAARAPIQVELFLDLVCPFSRKMFKTVHSEVIPSLKDDSISFVLQQVPQPWHPQGTYVHEAALAVKEVSPSLYPAFVDAVYDAFDAGKVRFSGHLQRLIL
jgi:protein-disulfide isomerase